MKRCEILKRKKEGIIKAKLLVPSTLTEGTKMVTQSAGFSWDS